MSKLKIELSEAATQRFTILVEACESRLAQSVLQKNGEETGWKVEIAVIQCIERSTGKQLPLIAALRHNLKTGKTEVCPVAILLEGDDLMEKYVPTGEDGEAMEPEGRTTHDAHKYTDEEGAGHTKH